jgi:hypothetical protein
MISSEHSLTPFVLSWHWSLHVRLSRHPFLLGGGLQHLQCSQALSEPKLGGARARWLTVVALHINHTRVAVPVLAAPGRHT